MFNILMEFLGLVGMANPDCSTSCFGCIYLGYLTKTWKKYAEANSHE